MKVIYNWEEATGLVVKEGYGQTETTLLLGTFKVTYILWFFFWGSSSGILLLKFFKNNLFFL